jgi:hypothetical protein
MCRHVNKCICSIDSCNDAIPNQKCLALLVDIAYSLNKHIEKEKDTKENE